MRGEGGIGKRKEEEEGGEINKKKNVFLFCANKRTKEIRAYDFTRARAPFFFFLNFFCHVYILFYL